MGMGSLFGKMPNYKSGPYVQCQGSLKLRLILAMGITLYTSSGLHKDFVGYPNNEEARGK